jgi:hypothetical protein
MLVERTNKITRTQIIQAEATDAAGQTVGTIFQLKDGEELEAILGCRQYCGKDIQGNHNSFHR